MQRRRLYLAAAAPIAGALVIQACGPSAVGRPVGVSGYGGGDETGSGSASASSSASVWAAFSASTAWPRANARRFASQGHFFGKLDADVRVSPSASSAYASVGIGTSLPTGSTVVEVLVARGSDAVVSLLVMEKEERGWRYLDVDSTGRVRGAGSALAPCASCHAHVASQDYVFGVPSNGM